MNILYCGDSNIEDGLLISIISLTRQIREPLHIYVLTMRLEWLGKTYDPVSDKTIAYLDSYVKRADRTEEGHADGESFVKGIDVTEYFQAEAAPDVNMQTRFTPFCMLRLYADQVEELPERLLYLDNDVVCRRDIAEFYHQDIDHIDFAGVLDYYGGWFFRRNLFRRDYINSGVLLLNMDRIRRTGLFGKCRERCRTKKMFMPDQSALNKLAEAKRICPRRYNEQRKLHEDTALQHFTTSFRFWPWIHTITVKPWQVEQVHEQLKLYEYDDILQEYQTLRSELS